MCSQCKLFWVSEKDNIGHCFKNNKIGTLNCKDFEKSGFSIWGKKDTADSEVVFARELFDEGMSQV